MGTQGRETFWAVFWGNIAATALFVIVYGIFSAIQTYREKQQINELMKSITSMAAPPLVASPYPSVDPRSSAERVQAMRPRRLSDSQRCVGGVVIVKDGSSYTQTGERCTGIFIVP